VGGIAWVVDAARPPTWATSSTSTTSCTDSISHAMAATYAERSVTILTAMLDNIGKPVNE
jgi:hypothetical protein